MVGIGLTTCALMMSKGKTLGSLLSSEDILKHFKFCFALEQWRQLHSLRFGMNAINY